MGGLRDWVGELKRRRVFRALVAYAIAAFAVLQVVEPIMHGAHWPDVVLSYVVAGLGAGFPIVLALAWIFDVKGGRIERTAPASASSPRGIRAALLLIAIGAAAAAPGLLYYFVFRPSEGNLFARGTGSTERGPSIAVLPFVNMSSDKENEYFSDGITEELTSALANIDGLRVASRTAAFAFKGKNLSIKQIGEELNVATILEGSIRRDRDNVRVVAQLIGAADGYHLWSKTYDREVKNVFQMEDELARSISQALRPKLVTAASTNLVKPSTASMEAHDLYLRGRFLWQKRTPESLARAVDYFQQAVELDPTYALAYVALADSQALLIEYGSAPSREMLPKAKDAVRRALEIDGALAEAHGTLAVLSVYEFDWTTAERELRRAIELKPDEASAHHRYALVLTMEGRCKEAQG